MKKGKLRRKEMDHISISDENCDLGHQFSPSNLDQIDQSPSTETSSHSIASADSFSYCRTNSEASATFSEPTDDSNSYADVASPHSWQGLKSPVRAALSKLGMRQHKHGLDDEIMDLASVFGQHHRLEPLHPQKKLMWKREMNCLLSVCDYIVEFSPTLQTLKDGTTLEVMASRPRSDIYINLPALRKLDTMLLGILDSFQETEFWYAEQGSISANSSRSFRRVSGQHKSQHSDDKWWLPVPCVGPDGLSEKSKKYLRQKRDCAYQIHKAAMAINSGILAEMQIPDSYMASLPKSGKASIGDKIYRYMYNAENFSPDRLLNSLDISSEHEALELADKVEASMYTWRRKICMAHSKSSSNKNHILSERADTLLFCLRQRYPELSQTTLDTSKIQYNKDVGQAVLESYSRVLEGLAFNIVDWIEDVILVDKTMKN
ncbi:Rop guanine nucleotide exchange factor [Striga asiatica]|uniref:Rop guanine nucleotide exchange factor n=1 Tax=Striga asiatica TaxID=4170 RepID=A0A5A7RJZ0_STRAF|nr:Rop guanine nucleotide exchange factor [Striga asiatica]